MRVLFKQGGCLEHCLPLSQVVNELNCALPIHDQISIVDVSDFDPRIKVLEEIFGPDRDKWILPIMIIDFIVKEKMFNSYVIRNRRRVITASNFDKVYDRTFYKSLLTI